MLRRYSSIITLSLMCLCLLVPQRILADEDPIQMLQSVTGTLMNVLRENRGALKRNPERVYEVVNKYIIPHADFVEMSRWVVGKQAWQQADEGMQRTFVEEFKNLVVRSYAQALLNYTDQTIEFLPLRGTTEGKTRVQIGSLIKQQGKNPVRIDYRLLRQGGTWKVYDIIIEGVSLMQGYRSQFNQDVQQGGLPNVVKKLQQHNRAPMRAARK